MKKARLSITLRKTKGVDRCLETAAFIKRTTSDLLRCIRTHKERVPLWTIILSTTSLKERSILTLRCSKLQPLTRKI